jgi:hypothetical protein
MLPHKRRNLGLVNEAGACLAQLSIGVASCYAERRATIVASGEVSRELIELFPILITIDS